MSNTDVTLNETSVTIGTSMVTEPVVSTEAPAFTPMTQEAFVAKVAAMAPPPSTRRTKVAILGFVKHFQLAPFNDPEFEIWGLNELYQFIPRWDRWFEIHARSLYENDRNRTSEHINKLKAMTCPVYMMQHWDDIPASVPYPLAQVMERFPNPCPAARPYLTNSISYMIALALMEGFQEIHLYGVDMSHDCLAPEMRVLTADLRWVRAGDLVVGQELLAFDEQIPVTAHDGKAAEFRKYRRTTVESLSTVKRPCYRLHMADGSTLVASEGHQWLTIGGAGHYRVWQETGKLQAQSIYPRHAAHIVKVTQKWEQEQSWQSGYLAAALDGEGHISQHARTNCSSTQMTIGFSQRLNGMSACVERAMAGVGFRFREASKPQDGCYKYSVKGPRAEVLRLLGTVRPPRLLEKFDADKVGTLNSIDDVAVLESEFIGEQEVVGIQTGTRTLIVEGFASHNSEYHSQRPSCEYFVGLAQGMGVKVYMPTESELLKANFLYGFEVDAEQAFTAKLKEKRTDVANTINVLDNQFLQIIEARAQNRGAHQLIDHLLKNWHPTGDEIERMQKAGVLK